MRATRFFLFAALLRLTRTDAEVGVGAVRAIYAPLSTKSTRLSPHHDVHDVGAGLVEAIQSSGKATGELTYFVPLGLVYVPSVASVLL